MGANKISYEELELKLHQLEKENGEYKKVQFYLNERVKELTCLNQISAVVKQEGISLDEKIQQITELIPSAFQYPEIAVAKITWGDKVFKTLNFAETTNKLSFPIKINGHKTGEISVFYSANASNLYPDFLKEESDLIFGISIRLAEIIDNFRKSQLIEESEFKYKNLIENISDIIYEYNIDGIITYISPLIEKNFGFKPEEVLGKDIKYFIGFDDAFKNSKIEELKQNQHTKTEYQILTKQGEKRWVLLSTRAKYENDEFIGGAGILTDITERKLTEIELNRSESLYRTILNSSPDNITLTDMQGNIILWSANAHLMFGADAGYDFRGHSILEYIHESDRERTMASISNRIKGGSPTTFNQFKAKRIDGSPFFIEVSWETIKNMDGIPVNMIFIIRDISDKKLAEEKLKTAEETYRRIIENINEAIYDIDINGTIKFISPSIYKISGFTPEEIIGRKMYELLGETKEIFDRRLINLQKNKTHTREIKLKNKAGEERWIRFSTNALIRNGKIIGGTGTLIDITEKKEIELELAYNEQLYSTILNVSPDVIVLCKTNGIIKYVSPSTYKMFGYDTDKEYIGRSILEFVAPDEVTRVQTNSERKLMGENIGVLEYRGIRANGDTFDFEVNTDVIRDITGTPLQVVLIIRDISDRKQMEANLQLSEVKFRNMIERINDVVFEIRADGTVKYVSPVIEKVLGYTPDELTDKSFFSYLYPADIEILKGALSNLSTVDSSHLEYRYYHKNGSLIWVRSSTAPLFEDGKMIGGIGVLTNIHERKIAEENLRKSEEKYRNIFETVQDAYYEASVEGIMLDISPSIKTISRGMFTRENLIGKSFVHMYADPNARNLLQQELFSKGKVVDYELEFKENELTVPVSISSVVIFDSEGKPLKITGSLRDITERKKAETKIKESEALYHSILLASPDVITLCDLQGNITLVSPRGSEMFGYDDFEMFIGHNMLEFIVDEDKEKALLNISKMFDGSGDGPGEYMAIKKDGSLFPVEINGDFIRNEAGENISLIFIIRDITERKKVQEELKLSEEKLRQSELRYKTFFEGNSSTMLLIDSATGKIMDANPAASEYYGWAKEELCSMNISQINTLSETEIYREMENSVTEKRKLFYFKHRLANGEIRDVEVHSGPMSFGNKKNIYSIVHDISERKKAEDNVLKLNRLRSVISNINHAIVNEENEEELLRKVCKITVETGNFEMAWIGKTTHDQKTIQPIIINGNENGYLSAIKKITIEDKPEGHGPTGTALREGHHYICNKIETDLAMIPWKTEALKRNYRSCMAIPLHKFDKIYGVLSLYSSQTDFFNTEETELLLEVINNVSYALEKIEAESERKIAEIQLRKLSQAVEQSPVSIVMTNVDGNIEYANPKACETTGYTFEELKGQNPRVLQSGETEKEEYIGLWNKITTGHEWHGLFHNKKKTGELYWESSTIAPIVDKYGKIISYIAIKEDITERKQAEEDLIKFRTIAEKASYGTAINNLNGDFIYVNPSWADMHGYSVDELIGKNLSIGHTDEQKIQVEAHVEALFRTGEMKPTEIWHVRKNGSVFPTLMSATIIYDQKNNPLFLSATCIEISNIKKAEEALRSSEANLNQAQEIAKMGSWELNFTNGDYKWSKNNYNLVGLTPDTPIQPDFFVKMIHPDDKDIFQQNIDIVTQKLTPVSVDLRLLLPNNNDYIWIQNNIVPMIENDKLIGIRGVNIDITEQKNKDIQINKLSLAVTQSPVSVVVTDTEGYIEFVNPAFEKVTGYTFEMVKGKNTRILKSGMNDQNIYTDLWVNIKNGQVWESEWINKRKNGELYWESISISPIKDSLGNITNFLALKQDITQKKNFEKEILELNQNLEKKILERTKELENANLSLLTEIDVRKRFEDALSESELKYRSVVENIQEVIFQTDNDGNWLFLNQSWEIVTGFTVTESLGKLFLDYVHPDDRQRNLEVFEPLIRQEKDYCRHEIRYLTKSGGYCWIEVYARLGFDKDGNTTGTYGSLRDISERKRAEEFENEMLLLSAQLTGVKLSEVDLAFDLALSRIGLFLNADRSYIFEIDDITNTMTNTYEWCNEGITAEIENLKNIPVSIFPVWMETLHKHENVIINSVKNLPPEWISEKEILEPQGIQSLIVLPLLHENQLIGFVGLDSVKSERNYNSAEINILKVWSGMLSSLITNMRKESLLELTRQNFEVFFNTIDDFLWVLDENANIIHINNTVTKRLNFKASELESESVLKVHPENRRDEAAEIVMEMLLGTKEMCPVPIMAKNGEQISVETRVKRGFWNGKPAIFGVSKDISQIQLSEQKFSTAFHSSSAVMAITRISDNAFVDVNNAFVKILGYSKEEVIGKTNHELQIYDEYIINQEFEKQSIDEFSVRELEVNVYAKNKEKHIFLLSTEQIYIGKDACILSVSVDITTRKIAEEQLQWNKSLLEMMSNSSPLGFLVVDNRTDDILYFNHRFCQIWGIENIEERMQKGEFKNNDIIPYCLPVLIDIPSFAESCKPLQDEENRVVVSDEIAFTGNRTIHRYSTQIRGTDDKYYGRFYIFEDVTDEKLAARELELARNEAEKANIAKSEFLSRMSHELRTPLNSILGFAQLLEMGDLNKGQSKGVGHILHSGKHLLNLINEVLDISRIESGRLSISLEPIKLSAVYEEMLDVLHPLAVTKNINMVLIDSPANNSFIRSDRQSLKQILLNLLNNAIKYNKPNGEVIITTELVPKSDIVRILISDTGVGILPEDINKLYTPFERVGAEKTRIEGTGLGLTVVKKLVEAMGGEIGVTSVPGEGSTFWLEFQRTESQLEILDKTELFSESETDTTKNKGTILYIEDNESNIQLMEQILLYQRPEVNLISEMQGRNAVKFAIDYRPDLILLDLNLPDIHGSEVLKLLLLNPSTKDIPVVVVSADAMHANIDRLLNLGAKTYLTKPIEVSAFLKVVDEFLKK